MANSRGGNHQSQSNRAAVQTPRQPPPLPSIVLVDSISACKHAVSEISTHRLVSVDLEGVELCRTGEICILQVALPNHRVFLFDICALRADAFEAGGLREILSGPSPLKLMYDCRADADALFHQYRVQLDGVYDLQVALVKARMNLAQKLPGLAVCIFRCCGETSPEAESFKLGKDRGAGVCVMSSRLIVARALMLRFQPCFPLSVEGITRSGVSDRYILSCCHTVRKMFQCCSPATKCLGVLQMEPKQRWLQLRASALN